MIPSHDSQIATRRMIVYLNGEFVAEQDAKVSVQDRGFLFGDAIYEAVQWCQSNFFQPQRHYERLRQGLAGLRIDSEIDLQDILSIGRKLIEENGLSGHVLLYLQISRGAAVRRHAFPASGVQATVYAFTTAIDPKYELRQSGASAVTFPDMRWQRCDLKTVNLLPNVLANQFAQERGAYEAILVRGETVTEATHCNVFACINGRLQTHPLTASILPGITREVAIECARKRGIPVVEEPISIGQLLRADEVLLTGTTTGVMPVIRVDDAQIGLGRPGPITRTLANDLQELTMALSPA